jgi:hypothetical protein
VKLRSGVRYLISDRKFRERTRDFVRKLETEQRRRLAAVLAADPIPPLEDVPIGTVVRFATEVRT